MKKLLLCALVVGLLFTMPLTGKGRESCFKSTVDGIQNNPTFLIVGVDNAGENTDFMMLSVYDSKLNSFNLLQIPRDTFCSGASSTGKINGIYSAERARGRDPLEAMNTLSGFISDSLGVRIDGFVSYSLASLERVVDSVGGVDINLKQPMDITDSSGKVVLSLKKGENHLSGKDAVTYIRHRKGYATQDLGRLDAQKIFLSAFLDAFKSEMGIELAARFIVDRGDGVVTNLRVSDFINLLVKNRGRISSMSMKLATMPGAAVTLDDVSYYSLSRASSMEILNEFGFSVTGEFDSKRGFRKKDSPDFCRVYDSQDCKYVIYDNNTVKELIPK